MYIQIYDSNASLGSGISIYIDAEALQPNLTLT
jgi:hypothetical protein